MEILWGAQGAPYDALWGILWTSHGGPRVLSRVPSGEPYGHPMGGFRCSLGRPLENPMEILLGA